MPKEKKRKKAFSFMQRKKVSVKRRKMVSIKRIIINENIFEVLKKGRGDATKNRIFDIKGDNIYS